VRAEEEEEEEEKQLMLNLHIFKLLNMVEIASYPSIPPSRQIQ